MSDEITPLAAMVLDAFRAEKLKIVTAESCTGGLVAAALTDIAGSSDVFDRGFVTYSNTAKASMIGVPVALMDEHGAVSAAVARAMASGALKVAGADIAIAITGIAGPGGGTAEKPVGLVHFACARTGGGIAHTEQRFGEIGRREIRRKSVMEALGLLYRSCRYAEINTD